MSHPAPLPRRGRRPVLVTALVLVAGQVVLRGWAAFGSWFSTDDFRLLYDASRADLDADYLLAPFDSQFMPLGRLLAWVVQASGPLQWQTAAALTTGLQALCSLACVWMLLTLFGARWGILPPLAVYLFSPLTLPAFQWWAASLNQLPLQAVAFVAVAHWVRHLRTPSRLDLALVVLALGVGMLAYVKTLLLLPLLLMLQLGWFTSGTVRQRLAQTVVRRGAGAAALTLLGAGFSAYYLSRVPAPLTDVSARVAAELLGTMLGQGFPTAAVGGPWRWSTQNPPVTPADPPVVGVVVAWLGCAGVVAASLWVRRGAGKAWLLLAAYLAGDWLLLATSRAPLVGSGIGLELRYLTDAAAVLALCLGLALLELRGAPGSSSPDARRRLPAGRLTAAVATGALVAGALASTLPYVETWQDRNPAERYLATTMADLAALGGPVPLADQVVPASVMPGYLYPYSTTARLLTLLPQPVAFPVTTPQLYVLAPDGGVYQALVDPGVRSRPGPVPGCGWRLGVPGGRVPLTGEAFAFPRWVRIGYAASAGSPVVVTAGDERFATSLQAGPHSLFVRTTTAYDELRLTGLGDGVSVCVDTVEVGDAVPGLVQ